MVLLPNQLTSEWLVGEELLPLLERGDLIEVKRPLQNNGLGYYMVLFLNKNIEKINYALKQFFYVYH
jgi:hypothetical protein